MKKNNGPNFSRFLLVAQFMMRIKFNFNNFIFCGVSATAWQCASGIRRRRRRLWLAAAACSRPIQWRHCMYVPYVSSVSCINFYVPYVSSVTSLTFLTVRALRWTETPLYCQRRRRPRIMPALDADIISCTYREHTGALLCCLHSAL